MALAGTIGLAARQGSTEVSQSPPADDSRLPPGPARALVVQRCGVCHDVLRAASVRLTREGWAAVVEGMVMRGARISEDEFPQVVDYLATNFEGEAPRPININSAPSIDFESVLGLLRREAAAVVAYREKNGPFKQVTDLKKVPGLDYKKIEDKTDRIVIF